MGFPKFTPLDRLPFPSSKKVNPKEYDFIIKGITEYFKDEPEKITTWWFTPNPHFGGTPPAFLMVMKPNKAIKIIKALLKGDS